MIQGGDRVFLPEFGWNGTVNYVSGDECEVSMDYPTYTEGHVKRPIWTIRFLVKNVVSIESDKKA